MGKRFIIDPYENGESRLSIKYFYNIKSKSKERESEDQIEVFDINDIHYFVLCDGAGGYGNGLEASKTAIKHIKEYLISNSPCEISAKLPLLLSSAISSACLNLTVKNIGQTTVILVAINNEGDIFGASVGDSKAKYYSDNIFYLTAHQNKIRAGDLCIPVSFETKSREGKTLLVMGSDGLWDYISSDYLDAILSAGDHNETINSAYDQVTKIAVFDDFSMLIVEQNI